MAYNAPATVVTGDLITAAKWNADVSANPIAIYAGAVAISGQAANRIIYASSTTQFATSAGLTFDGTNLTTTGAFASGATPATGGQIRLPYNAYVAARNQGNTDNIFLIGLATSTSTNRILIGDTAQTDVAINGSLLTILGNSATFCLDGSGTNGLGIGSSHASGDVRIYSRNALAVTFGASQLATFTGLLQGPAGFATAPTYSFSGDPNTGIYSYAGDALGIVAAGRNIANFYGSTAYNYMYLLGGAWGTGAVTGSLLRIDRNTSGNGAPGMLALQDKANVLYYIWVDSTGDLRIGTAPPEEDGTPADTSGTIVGTQS